jgi:hypothetical protein
MKELKVLLLLLFSLLLIFLLFTFGPFILMSFIDSSWYYSEAVNVGPVDYNAELAKAEEAGYTIRGSWPWPGDYYSGFEPGEVAEVKDKFGNATVVQEVRLYYDSNSELVVCKYDRQPETYLAFTNTAHLDLNSPLAPSEYPEEEWTLEMLGLLFDLDEATSRLYLTELKAAAQNQTWDVRLQVNESLDFPSVYGYLKENSINSRPDVTAVLAQGSDAEEIFIRNESKLGYIKYFIPTAEVETFENKNKYKLELRASGDVKLEILMPIGSSGETIPEEEYRAVFREMFENMGLTPEAIDRFEFFYSTSRAW